MLSRIRHSTPADHDAGPFKIPDPVEVSDDLRELLARKQQFESQVALLKRELDDSVAAGQKGRRRARVMDILAGKPRVADQQRDPGEIYDELCDVQEAAKQIDEQIIAARSKASEIIREIVAPEHRRLVGEIARTMVAVRDAWAQYLEFADGLNSRQISWSALRPMHPNFLGSPRDRQSTMAFWFREAVSMD